MKYFFVYLIIINLLTAIFFVYDKIAAGKGLRRITEASLHLLELLGAVFVILFLMYLIRHKNRKPKYYIATFLILILWILIFLMIKFDFYRLANI